MATAPPKKPRKRTSMSDAHKAALAKGREEGRIVRRYLEALESTKPRRGRKRTPESIKRRLATIDSTVDDADPLARLHLIEERQRLEAELTATGDTVDLAALEKDFIKVARLYGDRKGISYSARASSSTRPSAEPSSGSEARSGCGISPTTLRPTLHTPAMSSTEPLGLST